MSADEVRHLPFVHKDSDLLGDRLETVADERSISHERVERFGDFDAINLDFCDSIGRKEAGASDSALEAILKLVSLQSSNRAKPWLLFITTRSDRATVKRSVMVKLLHALEQNLANNRGFLEKASRGSILNAEAIRAELLQPSDMDDAEFMKAFGIGFSKWLLSLIHTTWKVEQKICASYRVSPDAVVPDMLSLAFRFEKQPHRISDALGLVKQRKTEAIPRAATEEELAIKFLENFKAWVDVDRLLFDDLTLREAMIAENADLMAQARFDRDFLIQWGRKHCWQPSRA